MSAREWWCGGKKIIRLEARRFRILEAAGGNKFRQHLKLLEQRNAATHSRAGAVHYVCTDWRHLSELLEAGQHLWRDAQSGGVGQVERRPR